MNERSSNPWVSSEAIAATPEGHSAAAPGPDGRGARPIGWVAAGSGLLVAAVVIWILGYPFPLVATTVGLLAALLASRSSLAAGVAGSLILLLGSVPVLIRVAVFLPVGLPVTAGIVLALAGALFLVLLWRTPATLLPAHRTAVIGGVALAMALAAAIAFISWRSASGAAPIWAMHNDATVQMIKAIPQIEAGGLDTRVRPNSSPLTSALIAIVAAVGRLGVSDVNRYLENDLLRAAELWSALVTVTVVLAALIATRATTAISSRCLRGLAVGLVAVLPLTWYMLGFALAFGFFNSTLALVILLASWLVWLEAPQCPPSLAVLLLSLAAVAMLATWAPVALIPAALALLAVVEQVRATRRVDIWLVLAAAPLALYGVFVTLPDFAREGEALAVYGGIVSIPIIHVFLVCALAALAALIQARANGVWRDAVGLAAVMVAGGIGVAFLAYLNWSDGMPFWGYYPVKAAWTLTSLVLVIGLASALAWAARAGGEPGATPRPNIRDAAPMGDSGLGDAALGDIAGEAASAESRWPALAAMAVTVLVAVALMLQYTPGVVGLRNALAPLDVLRSAGPASGAHRANVLFDLYRYQQATMAVRIGNEWNVPDQVVPGDGRTDRFANLWLLQMLSTDGADPIREFAYFLDTYDAAQICAAIATWGRDVMIFTDDGGLQSELAVTCPTYPFTVELITHSL